MSRPGAEKKNEWQSFSSVKQWKGRAHVKMEKENRSQLVFLRLRPFETTLKPRSHRYLSVRFASDWPSNAKVGARTRRTMIIKLRRV